jgi:hypothetical protein
LINGICSDYIHFPVHMNCSNYLDFTLTFLGDFLITFQLCQWLYLKLFYQWYCCSISKEKKIGLLQKMPKIEIFNQ